MSQTHFVAPAFTHMGIFTDNPEAMQEFYVRVLGMVVSDTGSGMLFRRRIIRTRMRLDQQRSGKHNA
jgi:catechol 2,3-dioxygenase-like lactoylglutathione lyase family enzyme